MDIPDDPSTTTTNTTDYDSGDSEGVDYVYEGQLSTERATSKPRSPRRRSPKAKHRGCRKCAHAALYAEDEADFTVFEEDTDTEDEDRVHHKRSTKSHPSGHGHCLCHGEQGRRNSERKTAETKTARRARSPYVEEYPDLVPRPLIILKEHRISGRPTVPDAKRLRDSVERSLSNSRGRSPAAKPPPPRPSRLTSKDPPSHHHHHKRRPVPRECQKDNRSGSEARNRRSDSGGPLLATRRRNREARPEMPSTIARSSAWDDTPQPQYSSSWPLQKGGHLSKARPKRRGHDDSNESESESESEEGLDDDDNFDDPRHLIRTRAPSFREHVRERELERSHKTHHRETPPPEPEREHDRRIPLPRTRPRPKTITSRASMATMDQGYRSVATSLCDVWQGESGEWESPYASASEDDLDSGVDEPIGLLRMDDLPARGSSPRLLPPRGGREDFGFQAANQPLPSHTYRPSIYLEEPPSRGYRDLWPAPLRTGLLVLEAPPASTTEPDVMTDNEDLPDGVRGPHSWVLQLAPPRHRLNNPHLPPPRSRAVSPVFSARKTREFLSPRPTRAARFDFDAWGCERGSASSISLGWV
ncbi:hypothetical protein C8A05DRAFT_38387 [Staphylotrichum tortipilum]|uniref:Uncharacterized protein n=1 Tax=Staphylotrichum tortipilum TaxID=2831512 RepID=A0AAN6RPC1_9PEZI|nr:hypothetical protein C8A05DRAFT_38387 [Staphylotrichum longicolle]